MLTWANIISIAIYNILSYEIMHRMMFRGVLKDALERIPIRNKDLDLIGVNWNTKTQTTKGQSKQTDKMTWCLWGMSTCALSIRARGGEDAAVLYSFSYCFILTLDLQQYTHTKENISLKEIEINWNI